MPDVNALTYIQLQDAVLGRRFPAGSQRDNAKRWLATAYQDVWSAADWTFKRVSRASLAMTGGDATPTMPADFADAIELYDDSGAPLMRYSQEEFEYRYADTILNGASGLPEAYTVVNRQIEVAPLPGTTTFTLSYKRRLLHRNSADAEVVGFMDNDDDYPYWDDHHALLIPRAMVVGLQEINDPTWGPLQEEYERQLSRMQDDYVQRNPAVQWGVAW